MKVEIPLTGRPEINLSLTFTDTGKHSDTLEVNLWQRGSAGSPPVMVQIGNVSKNDIKRLARSC